MPCPDLLFQWQLTSNNAAPFEALHADFKFQKYLDSNKNIISVCVMQGVFFHAFYGIFYGRGCLRFFVCLFFPP